MAVRITHVKKGIATHENPHMDLSLFKWINEQTQASGSSDLETMYDWIVNQNGKAYVRDSSGNPIYVFGVETASGEHYIRTAQDKKWSDDLLNLPSV